MSALLQVLWTGREFQDLSLSKFELETWKREADKLLATFQSWANYRQSFLNGPIREGTFALAKKYQLQAAASKDENFQPSVAFSPIANRTRAKVGNLAQKLSTGRASTSSEVPGTPEVEDSPFQTPGPEKLTPLMYPQTKKEQIVNAALVDYLNMLMFEDAAFKARTNGYLEDGGSSERVRALIEVKPMLRRKKLNPIRMQEAAQMVAWIMSDPDPTGALNLPGR
ncbi:hypothetical protein BO99DRAFT_424745 [Aspergillus violaceofuscus CBS 115571]|uniref:Uncharacterized protein n=2 Tax=Aspergillus TaxID=5052 RepID=A0A2V5GYB7_ASPV1|nr:hypothetical protein BO99DRAFT_424745 [Aspergillus violaceofuscus CBS 115571]